MRRPVIIISSVAGLCLLLVAGWLLYQSQPQPRTTTPQPAQPSSPAPEVTPTPTSSSVKPTTMTFTSPKGVVITLDNWTPSMHIKSPQTITGAVPGNWSFEASFPVELIDGSGKTLVKTPAHLTGDWMTTQSVPFTVDVSFTMPSTETGTLRLHKDNPSGLPANDDSIDIPVQVGL